MKRGKGFEKIFVIGLFAMLLIGLPLGGEYAFAKDPVKVSACFDLSGPYAVKQKLMFQGWKDYFEYVNTDLGGIKGHPVEYKWGDSHMEIPKELAFYEEAKAWGTLAYTSGYSGGALALKERLKKDKIPMLGISGASPLIERDGYAYVHWGIYEDQTLTMFKWFMENKPKDMSNKVAGVHMDNAAGRSVATEKWLAYAKDVLKVDVVTTKFIHPGGGGDVTPIVTALKDGGVNFVASLSITGAQATLLKDASRLGVMAREPFEKGKIMFCSMPATNMDVVPLIGKDAEGMMFACSGLSFDEDLPGVKFVKGIQIKRHGRADITDNDYMNGMAAAAAIAKGIERALEKVPYEKLNGEAVKIHGLDGLKIDLGYWTELDYTKSTYGPKKLRLYIVKGGKAKSLGGWVSLTDLHGHRQ